MGNSRLPRYAPPPLRRSPPTVVDSAPVVALPAKWSAMRWPWADSPRLASILQPENNSFSVLRFMLAMAVLVSHTIFLATGQHTAEPLVGLTGYSLGQYAVQGFFILSGILVTQSLMSRRDLMDYVRARALRVFPALFVCVLVTAFVAGPAFSFFGLPGYFLSAAVPNYVFQTLSLSTGSAMLPGVFALNPVGGAINQSLWTLKYEVACYLMLGGLAAIAWRLKANRTVTGIALAVWAALMLMVRPSLSHAASFPELLTYFSLFFGTGVAAYLLRDYVRIAWQPLPVLAGGFVLAWGTDLAEIMSAIFLGYGLLWLATERFGGLRAFTNRHDYSYGVYIYSFPVTQAVLQVWPGVNIVSLLAATIAITMILAFLSWELIERPALWLARSWRGASGHQPAPVASAEQERTTRDEAAVLANDATVAAVVVSEPVPAERHVGPLPALAPAAKSRPLIRRKPIADAEPAVTLEPIPSHGRLQARMAKITARAQPGHA